MVGYTIPNLAATGQDSGGPAGGSDVVNGLQEFFEEGASGDMDELAETLKDYFQKGVSQLGKELHSDYSDEKQGIIGHHGLHQFDDAMAAAFKGWPEDTDEYYKFLGHVFFSQGGGVILGNEAGVRAAFKRFTDTIWPGKPVPENRFWPLLKILANGVKYCRGGYADRKYRVELGPVMKRRDEVFDSQTLYNQKIRGRYVPGGIAPSQDSMKCRCIWVLAWAQGGEPVFYTHIGKLGRFHHSSFKAGEEIMAAGEWVIEGGRLTHINACSGHYKPEPWRFLTACNVLKNKGVITNNTLMEVWKNGTDRELVDCLPFLSQFAQKLQGGYQLYQGPK